MPTALTDPKKEYHIRHRAKVKYAGLKSDGARVWLRFSKQALKVRGGATLDTLLSMNKEWEAVEVNAVSKMR